MRKILSASAGVMVMSAGTVYAACIPTPSCSSLGYESSSSCEGGLKCPFGNAWNCTLVNKITEIEKIIQEGGADGNKGDTSNCVVGSIFYSDWTCSFNSFIQGKMPIGVVVYVDGQGHGQVMALKSIGEYKWSLNAGDVPGLNNFDSVSSASTDLQSCSNTALITAAGDKKAYPAAWTAHEYMTGGTNAGDWCLPAAGIMTSINNNMELVNDGFALAGGNQLESRSDLWSSSEKNKSDAWYSNFYSNDGVNELTKYFFTNEVRPVLEF